MSALLAALRAAARRSVHPKATPLSRHQRTLPWSGSGLPLLPLVAAAAVTGAAGFAAGDEDVDGDEDARRLSPSPLLVSLRREGKGTAVACRCEATTSIRALGSSGLMAPAGSGGGDQRKQRPSSLRSPFSRHPTARKLDSTATTLYAAPSRYVIDSKPLGEGSFGTVHLATDKRTGEAFALKRIPKEFTDDVSFKREMDALLWVRENGGHPHICGLRENFDEEDKYALVLDLVSGGEMFDHLIEDGAYSELDASRLIREVASALNFLHGIGIVHADLKPENLMLSSKRCGDAVIKVVDFGSAEVKLPNEARDVRPRSSSSIDIGTGPSDLSEKVKGNENGPRSNEIGANDNNSEDPTDGRTTPAYCPPEMFDDLQGDDIIRPSLDMWSLGIILYIMLVGVHPFDPMNDATDEEIERRIREQRVPDLSPNLPRLRHLSPSALDLMRRLLAEDPEHRITAQEMLHHPWVTGRSARRNKIEDIGDRLAAFKGLKSEIEKTVFENLIDLSCSGRRNSQGEKSTSLVARAFRSFDREGKGFLTVADVVKTDDGEAEAAKPVGYKGGASLTLSDFSNLISQNMKNRYFPRGQVIYKEGDTGHHVYFIDSGTVEVSTKDGFKTTLGHGNSFGEGAMFHDVRSATLRCKTPVHVLEVDRECFARYLSESSRSQDLNLNLRERVKARNFDRAQVILGQMKDLREVFFDFGDKLFEEGEDAGAVYIVDGGRVDVRTNGDKTVYSVGPGDIVGLNSLIFGRPRMAEAVCTDPGGCWVRAMASRDFQALMDSSPKMKEALYELCLRREFRRAIVHKMNDSFPLVENLKDAFDAVDTDGSGALDRDEVRELLLLLDGTMSDDKMEKVIRSLDLDNSGCVDFEEFKKVFAKDDELSFASGG